MVTQSHTCPRGGLSDRIQKVSSVYSEQTSSHSSTILAMKLAPPLMPERPQFTGWYISVSLFTIALFFAPVPLRAKIWFAGFLALLPLLFLFLFIIVTTRGFLLSSNEETTVEAIAIIIGVVWILCYLVINYGVLVKAQRRQNFYYRMITYPTWDEKRKKWDRLYYCYTHDCVFDSVTRAYTSSEKMSTLLE